MLLAVITGRRESCKETPRIKLMEVAVRLMLGLASKSRYKP